MEDHERPGRFIEPPLLEETAPPPPDRILVRGARLVRVYGGTGSRDVAGKPRPDGGREAVILAWARMPDRRWTVLMAWTSYWLWENPPHQTGLARWGWYLLDEERVKPQAATRLLRGCGLARLARTVRTPTGNRPGGPTAAGRPA